MVYSQHLKNNISVVRIVFEFYPMLGGSIVLTETLSKKIDCHLENQLIIAPDFGDSCVNFDKQFQVPIVRVKYYDLKKLHMPFLPLGYLLYMVQVYFKLKELNKKHNFNVIHAHGINIIGFSTVIGKILDIPVVGTVDGSSEAYSKISGFYETIMAKLFKPEYLIVEDDGPTTTEKFKKLLKERAIIVNIGIDTDKFKPTEKDKILIEKLGLKESDFIILSTSSLIPVKRIDLAIESFIRFLKMTSNRDAYLLIAGEGVLKDKLLELVENSSLKNNVKLLGGIPADIIPNYLSIADVVVGTSLYSNMNVSVQEAMACGVPVVAFDSGGTSRTINNMNNGILAKSGDVEDFARKLKILYDDPLLRYKLGQNARKTITEGRSWVIKIKKEMEIYERVLLQKNNK